MKLAFVDANVVLRFLTGDPPEMANQARLLFEEVDRGERVVFLEEIVVAEIIWVLASYYRFPRDAISEVLHNLISHSGIELENKPGIWIALDIYRNKNIDFIDALVSVRMAQHGVKEIFSFDQDFDKLPGIIRLAPGN